MAFEAKGYTPVRENCTAFSFRIRRSVILGLGFLLGSAIAPTVARSRPVSKYAPKTIYTKSACPQNLKGLVSQMLTDLPAYINRENTRANNRKTYVMLATKASFDDLPLFQPSATQPQSAHPPRQIFFTTLMRRYSTQTVVQQQEHHWLFLVKGDRGWQFVQLYSILDSYPSNNSPTPPRNSSSGSVAQAIKKWLNSCSISPA